jgi:hypothetical protein
MLLVVKTIARDFGTFFPKQVVWLFYSGEFLSPPLLFLSQQIGVNYFTRIMAFGKLSPESRIQDNLNELRITASFLAALDGEIGVTKLSQALRGIRPLENPDSIRLLNLTKRLLELRDAFEPVVLSFSVPDEVERMLRITATGEQIREAVAKLYE